VEQLELKGFKVDFYYTDKESFTWALSDWYQRLRELQQKEKQEQERLLKASDKTALELIKELFEKRHQMNDTKFIKELIRLAFQA